MKKDKLKMNVIRLADNTPAILITDKKNNKFLKSDNYNFAFNHKNGKFDRWGKAKEDDSHLHLGLPEIADIEISEVCSAGCKFCYKSNTTNGRNMSFETFKIIFDKLPPTVTQIAFGIGDLPIPKYFDNEVEITKDQYYDNINNKDYNIKWFGGNPEMLDMFQYCKDHGVVPNLTINGFRMTEEVADKLKELCGAVAVSVYDNESSYNTIKMLTDREMTQINIHFFLAEETYDNLFKLIHDVKTDSRLDKLNSIVLLSLKKKGRAIKNNFNSLSMEKFKYLINYFIDNKVSFGFDSCTAQKVTEATRHTGYYNSIKDLIEPCESTIFSMYINVEGIYYPCSFTEGTDEWEEGIDILKVKDFLSEVWYSKKVTIFKNKCIECRNNGISCPAGYIV